MSDNQTIAVGQTFGVFPPLIIPDYLQSASNQYQDTFESTKKGRDD